MNKQSVPLLGMGLLLNKNVFVGAKTLWAARVSNPARRIKRHVHPALACIDSCSFVLISAGIELK